jgi:hypothetical protein
MCLFGSLVSVYMQWCSLQSGLFAPLPPLRERVGQVVGKCQDFAGSSCPNVGGFELRFILNDTCPIEVYREIVSQCHVTDTTLHLLMWCTRTAKYVSCIMLPSNSIIPFSCSTLLMSGNIKLSINTLACNHQLKF